MFISFSPKTRWNIFRILPFGVIWLLTGWVFLFVEIAVLGGNTENAPESAIRMSIPVFIYATVAVTLVGLIIGAVEIFILKDLFSKRSFTQKIFLKLVIYVVILSIIILITFVIAASLEMDRNIFSEEVWQRYRQFVGSITHFSTGVQMTFSIALCLFYKEISDHIGQSVLLNLFSGKYHHPLEEERIFMFLDMKSSTTIAEKLGNNQYFELLKAYYATISDPVLDYGGDIYQYVGDELVVSWLLDSGITKNRCIECFYAMKARLEDKKTNFIKQYGVFPQFKAGIHHGMVTTGEIGEVKKDVLFTGDVLNATARIQALCNTYDAELLVSQSLLEKLSLGDQYAVASKGITTLRGKSEKVMLFSISKITRT